MNLSRKWLNEFVTVEVNDKEFAEAMTLSGSKVEGTEYLGAEIENVVVGKVLSRAELYGDYPCHRVVNHAGRLAPGFADQRMLLEQEGVSIKENGCVDMKHFQWDC